MRQSKLRFGEPPSRFFQLPQLEKKKKTHLKRIDNVDGVFFSLKEYDELLTMLVSENSDLAQRLAQQEQALAETRAALAAKFRAHPQAFENLAQAVQGAVDSMQMELARNANPIANFAVTELKFDTRLALGLNDLGKLEFEFFDPRIHASLPEAFTKMSISLTPVEKEVAESNREVQRAFATPIRKLSALIKPLQRDKPAPVDYLAQSGVTSAYQLLRLGQQASFRSKITAATGADKLVVEKWLCLVELMLLEGLTEPMAVILIDSGIKSLGNFAACDRNFLLKRLAHHKVTETQIVCWQNLTGKLLAEAIFIA